MANPYHPGIGTRPLFLAGRDSEKVAFRDIVDECPNADRNNLWVTGLRGAGKTALCADYLDYIDEKSWVAISRDWSTQRVWNDNSFCKALEHDLSKALRELSLTAKIKAAAKTAAKTARQVVSVETGTGATIKLDGEVEDSMLLADRVHDFMETVATKARGEGRKIIFMYDEAQYLKGDQLAALLNAVIESQARELPVMLVLAGLPSMIGLCNAARNNANRGFLLQEIGALDYAGAESPASDALLRPLDNRAISMDEDAVAEIVALTSGHPFFLQRYGYVLWKTALSASQTRITTDLLKLCHADIQAALDSEYFKTKFDDPAEGGQTLLRAAASLGEEMFRIGELVKRMNMNHNAVEQRLAGLIDADLIYRVKRGRYSYTIPLFGDYLRRCQPWEVKAPQDYC